MKPNTVAILIVGLILVPFPRESSAAEIQLDSPTPGLRVRMKGPVTLSGGMPMNINHMPTGEYQLDFDGYGTTTGGGRLTVGYDGQLSAKPLHGAGSLLLPPGISFLDSGHKKRGRLFLGLGVGSFTMVIIEEEARVDAQDDYSQALDAYNRATSPEEALALRLDTESAYDLVQDQEELRNLWGAYLGIVWLGSGVEAWLLTPAARVERLGEGSYRMDVPSGSGAYAGLRSALVPGAGQRAFGHEGRGNRFMLAVGLLGATSIVSQDLYLEASRDQSDLQRRYDAATSEEEIESLAPQLQQASDQAEYRNLFRWCMVGLTGAVYIWNIVDASSLSFKQPESSSLGLQLRPGASGLQVGLTWRIS